MPRYALLQTERTLLLVALQTVHDELTAVRLQLDSIAERLGRGPSGVALARLQDAREATDALVQLVERQAVEEAL